MAKRDDKADAHVRNLLGDFSRYVEEYRKLPPFTRKNQLSGHMRTLQLRAEAGSANAALEDGRFLGHLYDTLQAWGIGRRASTIVSRRDFDQRLRSRAEEITALDGLMIGTEEASEQTTALYSLIETLGLVENKAPLVPHTKALHHILPDLVVPMDREYTRKFLWWYGQQFQYRQGEVFRDAFKRFGTIAREATPGDYVTGTGWWMTRTKVIDNAIVGFVRAEGIDIA